MAISISGNAISVNSTVGSASSVLTSNGTDCSWAAVSGGFSGLDGKLYTSPGTFTVGTDCPTSITKVKFTLCGGGGNGGSSVYYENHGPYFSGGGGGGSSAIQTFFRTVSSPQVYTITVGGASSPSTIVLPTASPTTIFTASSGSNGSNGGNASGGAGGAAGAISPLTTWYGSAASGTQGGPGFGPTYAPGAGGVKGDDHGNAFNNVFRGRGGYGGSGHNQGGQGGTAGVVIVEW